MSDAQHTPTDREIYEGRLQALQSRDDEIDRLRRALEVCAAGYASPPCTMHEGYTYLANEFKRRMDVAGAALGTRSATVIDFPPTELDQQIGGGGL